MIEVKELLQQVDSAKSNGDPSMGAPKIGIKEQQARQFDSSTVGVNLTGLDWA